MVVVVATVVVVVSAFVVVVAAVVSAFVVLVVVVAVVVEATVKPLSVDDIAEILEKKPQKEKKQSDIIKIHYADIADSVMGLPKEEIEPLVRWLLTNNQSQIADYCNDKGFVSVVETTADSNAESIDGILMDDEDEFRI